MIPVRQTRFGRQGNCFAACVASLLERPIEHFEAMFPVAEDWRGESPGDEWRWGFRMAQGLAIHGLGFKEIPMDLFLNFPPAIDDLHLIAGVVGPSGMGHCVVVRTDVERKEGLPWVAHYRVVHCPLGHDVEFYTKIDSILMLFPLTL